MKENKLRNTETMDSLKLEINSLKEKLQKKELEYENMCLSKIETLSKENKRLEKVIEDNKNRYEEQIKYKESSFSDFMSKTMNKFSNFLTKNNRANELQKENNEIQKKNQQIISQQVNFENIHYIQELSLLKLDINMKEYKKRELDKNRVFRALYNVKFTVKLGIDLQKLRYRIDNRNLLHIFNVDVTKIGFEKFSGDPKVEFSEIRYRKTKTLGIGRDGWEVFDDDIETKKYEKDDIKNIIANINSDKFIKEKLGPLEEGFNTAVKGYFNSLYGTHFKIELHKGSDENALEYKDCFEKYNINLSKKTLQLHKIEAIQFDTLKNDILSDINNLKKGT